MKSFSMVFCFCLALIAMSASAQVDPGPNGLGLYADMDGMVNRLDTEPGMVELYLLATNVTEPNVSGWEFALNYSPSSLYFAGYTIPYSNVNVGTFPSFTVGLAEPIPQAPVMHLMTLNVGVSNMEPAAIYLMAPALPVGGSLGNDLPAFITAPDFYITAFQPSSGSVNAPVFRINGDAPVATEPATWGGVRALYR
jgi:hypothetical protein|nr:hypothetical protein [Candidatus Krumholzibacteria bacterium]